jgi:hypothetical protein
MTAQRVEQLAGVVQVSIKGFSAEFTKKMVDAVTIGLEPLGNSGRSATLYFLEKKNGVRLTDAFTNPSRFLATLTEMFGLGAKILEVSISKAIAFAFGLESTPATLDIAVKGAVRQFKSSKEHRQD